MFEQVSNKSKKKSSHRRNKRTDRVMKKKEKTALRRLICRSQTRSESNERG